MRLWLEQEKSTHEGGSAPILRLPHIDCSTDQRKRLKEMAQSTLCIWHIKRAKVILGALAGRPLESLVMDVRVPPETVVKCVEAFSKQGIKSLQHPTRKPTWRETRVEKMLDMLEKPSNRKGMDWKSFSVRYIGINFTGPMIQKIRALIVAHPEATRGELAKITCHDFAFYSPTGKAKDKTLTDILKRMDMDNIIRLPKVLPRKPYRKKKIPTSSLLDQRETRLWRSKDLDPLVFVPIRKPDQQDLWNIMMSRYHYLKRPKLFDPSFGTLSGVQILTPCWGASLFPMPPGDWQAGIPLSAGMTGNGKCT